MKLFGKKKKETVQDTASAPAAPKKKNRKDGMASVLSESVTERVLEDFRDNDRFATEKDGRPAYVGLLLDTADIGGLNRKSKKDEAKGSLIQQIDANHINTYIDQDLLDEEKIVFIPDLATLNNMDEFGILIDAPYEVVFVDDEGGITHTDRQVTYEDVKQFAEDDDEDLTSFLAAYGIQTDDGADDDLPELPADDEDDLLPEPPEDEDELPDYPDEEEEKDELADYPDEEDLDLPDEESQPVFDDEPAAVDYTSFEDDDDQDLMSGLDEEEEFEEDITEIPEELVDQRTKAVIYGHDLEIPLDTESMTEYIESNKPVLFDQLPGGWLNDQVNSLVVRANSDLMRTHNTNMTSLRQKYIHLMSRQAEVVQKALNIDQPGTEAYTLARQIDEAVAKEQEGLEARITERKAEIRRTYDDKLEQVGQDARARAMADYRTRHAEEFEDKLAAVQRDEENRVLAFEEKNRRDLLDWRRRQAAALMEAGKIEILRVIADLNGQLMENEKKQYDYWTGELNRYINDWRSEEVRKLRLEEEQTKTSEKLQAMRQEMDQKIRQERADREDLLDKKDREFREQLAVNETAWQDKLDRSEAQYDRLKDDYEVLTQKYHELDQDKDDRYGREIENLKNDKKRLRKELKESRKREKDNSHVMMAIWIGVALACLIFGLVIGMFVQSQKNDAYNRQLDAIDRQFETTENVGE